VSPYEIARLAEALALSTSEVIARYTSEDGTVLRQREDGGCSLLDGKRCGVHRGRPLVCRLYPLGRIVQRGQGEHFVQLSGHPESEGVFGEHGTIGEFIDAQGTKPYIDATARYFELFARLVAVIQARPAGTSTFQDVIARGANQARSSDEEDVLEWIDIDRTLARRSAEQPPHELAARVALHLALLEREIARLESEAERAD
jgi:hypothetical protein